MRIALPRGDIKLVRFLIRDRNGKLADVNFTEICFTVKRNAKDSQFEIQKKLSNGGITRQSRGDYQFRIEPEDTCNMLINNTRFPYYVFDIQVSYRNFIEETFTGTFVLTDEITYPENE